MDDQLEEFDPSTGPGMVYHQPMGAMNPRFLLIATTSAGHHLDFNDQLEFFFDSVGLPDEEWSISSMAWLVEQQLALQSDEAVARIR